MENNEQGRKPAYESHVAYDPNEQAYNTLRGGNIGYFDTHKIAWGRVTLAFTGTLLAGKIGCFLLKNLFSPKKGKAKEPGKRAALKV